MQAFVDRFRARATKADTGTTVPHQGAGTMRPIAAFSEERLAPIRFRVEELSLRRSSGSRVSRLELQRRYANPAPF
ncbi:MAG: hypothetical protein R3D29_12725 [Nitratireductor sp.]